MTSPSPTLDGSGKPANGRSLMKVVALGVKKGHHLRFTANGEDAEAALKAIGEAINEGRGRSMSRRVATITLNPAYDSGLLPADRARKSTR